MNKGKISVDASEKEEKNNPGNETRKPGPSPHDQFFTYVFSDKENLRDLLKQYLPPSVQNHIDLSALSITKESYVDDELRKSQSDLLVKARLKENKEHAPVLIYILLEHKAYPDRWTIFQILKYMVRIWEKHAGIGERRKSSTLPVISPIIFYHGRSRWNYPLSFEDLFEKALPRLTQYIPRFKADLINAGGYESPGSETGLHFQAAMTLFKYSFRGLEDHVSDILRIIAQSPLDQRTKDFLSAIFRYILIAGRRGNKNKIERAIEGFEMKEVQESYMTIADELMEEGELKGKIEEKQQVLVRLLKRKFGLSREETEQIMAVVDPYVLDRALDEIITAERKEEVLELLQ